MYLYPMHRRIKVPRWDTNVVLTLTLVKVKMVSVQTFVPDS